MEMTDQSIASRLRKARISAGHKTASEAANAIGVSVPTYLGHENGSRQIRQAPAERYARAFNVSLAWLLTGYGEMVDLEIRAPRMEREDIERAIHGHEIPEVDVAPDGSDLRPCGTSWGFPEDFARVVLGVPSEGLVAMACRGDWMGESIRPHERVFVDTRHTRPSPDGVYAIRGPMGGVEVRRLHSLRTKPGRIAILGDGKATPEEEVDADEVVVIGRVVCSLHLL